MFLYAKIIIESIEMLPDVGSIREQLEVLPEGLDEAYVVAAELGEKMNPHAPVLT